MASVALLRPEALLLLLLPWAAVSGSPGTDHITIRVKPGTDVVLPCEAPEGTDLEDPVLEWSRSDLKQSYVFLFRDGRPFHDFQHFHFNNRVQLVDPTLRSGNLSIKLHKVGLADNGTYGCHIFSHSHVRKRSVYNTKPIRTIDLMVVNPKPETIRASPGQDVELRLEKPEYPVSSFVWKREDDPEHFVFLFGMGHPHHQSPQYSGRTELRDRDQDQDQLRDLSVILRRVQPSDSGTYHGLIVQSQQRKKRDLHQSEPHSVIILKVETSGALKLEAGFRFMAAVLVSLFLQKLE